MAQQLTTVVAYIYSMHKLRCMHARAYPGSLPNAAISAAGEVAIEVAAGIDLVHYIPVVTESITLGSKVLSPLCRPFRIMRKNLYLPLARTCIADSTALHNMELSKSNHAWCLHSIILRRTCGCWL